MIGTLHEKVYPARGHRFIAEFYADLDYDDDGGLIITREHDAKDPAEAAANALRAIKEGKVRSVGGKDISVGADTICVHSDTPNAVKPSRAAVREAVKPLSRPRRRTDRGTIDGQADSLAAARHLLPQAGARPAGVQGGGRQCRGRRHRSA